MSCYIVSYYIILCRGASGLATCLYLRSLLGWLRLGWLKIAWITLKLVKLNQNSFKYLEN